MLNMKSEIRSGIAIGLGGFLWLLLEFALGFHHRFIDYQPFFNLLSFVIPIVGIYWAMKAKRDRYYNGKISFMNALKTGMYITAVISIITPLLTFLYITVVNPLFLVTMLGHEKLIIDELNISPEDKTRMITDSIQNYSLLSYTLRSFFIALFSGVILSTLTALLMKRNVQAKAATPDHSITDFEKKG